MPIVVFHIIICHTACLNLTYAEKIVVLIIFAQWVSVAHIMQLSVHYLKNSKFQTGFYFLMIVVVSLMNAI